MLHSVSRHPMPYIARYFGWLLSFCYLFMKFGTSASYNYALDLTVHLETNMDKGEKIVLFTLYLSGGQTVGILKLNDDMIEYWNDVLLNPLCLVSTLSLLHLSLNWIWLILNWNCGSFVTKLEHKFIVLLSVQAMPVTMPTFLKTAMMVDLWWPDGQGGHISALLTSQKQWALMDRFDLSEFTSDSGVGGHHITTLHCPCQY